MSGYFSRSVTLVNKINRENEDFGMIDFSLYKNEFYEIEKIMKSRKSIMKVYNGLWADKIKQMEDAFITNEDILLNSYLFLLKRVNDTEDPVILLGIIVLMVPVICHFLRRTY